jgi:hypothetical protein
VESLADTNGRSVSITSSYHLAVGKSADISHYLPGSTMTVKTERPVRLGRTCLANLVVAVFDEKHVSRYTSLTNTETQRLATDYCHPETEHTIEKNVFHQYRPSSGSSARLVLDAPRHRQNMAV